MKNFFIFGVFFQFTEDRPVGLCGALWTAGSVVIGGLKRYDFAGLIKTDDNESVFLGKMKDEFGISSITGLIRNKDNNQSLCFDKTYPSYTNNPVHYAFNKNGDIYLGNFTIHGVPEASNGWSKCILVPTDVDDINDENLPYKNDNWNNYLSTPMNENFFGPYEFEQEIDQAWNKYFHTNDDWRGKKQ